MGAPVLIGAGIGALTSLATGRDPLQGAALGGVTGGAFGGSTGFGSGFTEGGLFNLGSAITPSVPQIATEGVAQSALTQEGIASPLLGSGNVSVGMGLEPYNMGSSLLSNTGAPITASQAGFQAASPMNFADATGVVDNAIINPSTYMGGLDEAGASGLSTGGGYVPDPNAENFVTDLTTPVKTSLLEDIGSTAYDSLADMSTMDKIGLGAMTLDAITPEERAAVESQMARISPPKGVVPERGTMIAINTPRRTYKPRFA